MARSSEAQIIRQAASKAGIDPKILWGLYGAETNFGKNKNVSSAGAQGPFQFMPGTAKSMGVDPHNFRQAAYGAARYLAQYKDRGTRGMLAAYNAGPAGNPNNPETRAYVPKVLQLAKTFPGGGGGSGSSSRSGSSSGGTRRLEDTRITGQSTSGSVATYQPGVDNSAMRQQVTANYFQNRGKPGNLLGLIAGLQNAKDQPSSLDTRATASTAYTATLGSPEPVAAGSKVSQYKAAADLLDAAKLPYKWGGGHGKKLSPLKTKKDVIPVDCSGAVSAVLGINPRVSGQFESWGRPGKGKKVTIYANEGHVLMEIDGKFFGTSKTNPGGGAGWIPRSKVSRAYLSKFTARHPVGL